MSESATIERNPIPLHERIAVKASEAAALMSCSRSTFFAKVKAGVYPKPGPDGRWGVKALLSLHQATSPTKPSNPAAAAGTAPGCTQP